MNTGLSGGQAAKILVVEDEFMLAMNLSKTLRSAGYEIVGPVATVSAALATLQEARPDACILDIGLRGQMSTPVAVVLKEQNIPFLLATAYKAEILEADPLYEGVINVGKPIQDEDLLSALGSLLQRH